MKAQEPNAPTGPGGEHLVRYSRLYVDENGESHYMDMAEPLHNLDFVPPALPLNLSDFMPATKFAFLEAPLEWIGDWHPSPQKQIFFFLTGELELTASDGEARSFPGGSILLAEDTWGKGHYTRVLGDCNATCGVVQLP